MKDTTTQNTDQYIHLNAISVPGSHMIKDILKPRDILYYNIVMFPVIRASEEIATDFADKIP